MIPNFNSYNILNESVSLNSLKNGNARGLGYGDMKRGFLSKDYEFLGNVSLKVKNNNISLYEEILNVIPDDLLSKLNECKGSGYITSVPEKKYIFIDLFGQDSDDKCLKILAEPNIEKVESCFTKKGDLYYVLWNPEQKYFYFMTIDKKSYYNYNMAIGFLELYIKIKTSGIEEVTKEVDDIYAEYLEKKRKHEEAEMEKKEQDRLNKEKEEIYQKRVDAIEADVKEHPENYKEVKKTELPQDILDAINSDDYMDSRYAVYVEHISTDPYDVETVMCYVNDDEFTDGYKFEQTIKHSRPGTYWGD